MQKAKENQMQKAKENVGQRAREKARRGEALALAALARLTLERAPGWPAEELARRVLRLLGEAE